MEKAMETIRYAWGRSSLGDFLAASSDRGLVLVEFASAGTADILSDHFQDAEIIEEPLFMSATVERLAELFEYPDVPSDLPVDMRGSEFELSVWQALRQIPPGKTASYGEIAARIGSPKAAREVAEACAANRLAVVVPCHRVVKKDGSISGYRWGFKRKRALIEREREGVARRCQPQAGMEIR
jgi:AraC family transcriptional regulator of adaptative response/methylated-DNA-[protein]-cysteine methyltransferase